MKNSAETLMLGLEAGSATPDLAAELGVGGIPIDGEQLLRDGAEKTVASLRERGLLPCQIGAFFFNPLHPDPAERAAGARKIADLIPLAAVARCRWIAFPGGSRCPDVFGGADPGNLSDEALDEAARAIAPLAEIAEAVGVVLTLEPHLRSVLSTPERAARLCARVGSPALKITFDVSNFYDFPAMLAPSALVSRARDALADWCGLIHLKEVAPLAGFHLHAGLVPMGEGHTDWAEVLRAAAQIAPAGGWVLVEHCAGRDEAMRSVGIVRAAARKEGVALG